MVPPLTTGGSTPPKGSRDATREDTAPGRNAGPRGAECLGPIGDKAVWPTGLGGGLGLDTLVKQSMSSKVLDSRPSLDFGLRPSLQQEADPTDQSCLQALAAPPSHLECA